jgi:tetratricopeptide (TPR) repeat protein
MLIRAEEGIPKAEAAAHRALKLDKNLAEAHEAMARVKVYLWDWVAAEREYKRAIELNPNLSSPHSGYSGYLSVVGRHDEAIAEAKRLKELDPLWPNPIGFLLYSARRYDEAIEALKNMIEMHQDSVTPRLFLGYTYAAKGMLRGSHCRLS